MLTTLDLDHPTGHQMSGAVCLPLDIVEDDGFLWKRAKFFNVASTVFASSPVGY